MIACIRPSVSALAILLRASIIIVLFGTPLAGWAQTVTTTIAAGREPIAIAANPVSNKIYVINFGSNSVTVIDGATNTTATVSAGTAPLAIAVNPVSNKTYVANSGSSNVTVIDGATNLTATVAAGAGSTVPAAV